MIPLRRLNERGLRQMHEWLDQVGADGRGSVPESLMYADSVSEPVESGVSVEETKSFPRRFEWALYIESVLAEQSTREVAMDKGLWAWLTLVYFDQVCPVDAVGVRDVLDRPRYVPTIADYKTYYRHLLLGPWSIVRAHRDHPDRATALLVNPLHKPGEVAEQVAARQELITSRQVVEVAGRLYYEPSTGGMRRGSGSKGPGTPRRLVAVLRQLSLNFDFQEIGTEALFSMLPKEFRKFIGAPSKQSAPGR